jgi:citrate lyase subunit beta / citryl-CoA lyase
VVVPCSLLIVPGDRADLMAKVTRCAPDAVILDLEDGVAPNAKDTARSVAAQWAQRAERAESSATQVLVRVNAVGTPQCALDVAAAVGAGATVGLVVPKVESVSDVRVILGMIRDLQEHDELCESDRRAAEPRLLIAGIETARGVEHAFEIAAAGASGLYFGAEDFIADVRGVRTRAGGEVAYARARTVVAARAAGSAPFDQVVVDVHDDDAFVEGCMQARSFGFDGKLCIHPRQVELLHEAFDPSPAELAAAHDIIAGYEEALAAGAGVCVVEGRMVDAPLVEQARVIDARARRAAARRRQLGAGPITPGAP